MLSEHVERSVDGEMISSTCQQKKHRKIMDMDIVTILLYTRIQLAEIDNEAAISNYLEDDISRLKNETTAEESENEFNLSDKDLFKSFIHAFKDNST